MKRLLFIVIASLALPAAAQGVSLWLRTSAEALCSTNPFFSFMPRYTDEEGIVESNRTFIYEYSEAGPNAAEGTDLWETFYTTTIDYTQWTSNLREGWYRVSMAPRAEDVGFPERYIVSESVYIARVDGACTPFSDPWPDEISDNVCPRGTLLFREDFGGNSPLDPVTSPTPLTTMSYRYTQAFDVISRVASGKFVVAKHGWKNNLDLNPTANTFSQWFIQDDHTYPNDYSRGYLLEVDGRGGNDAFYTTRFPVCANMDLTFSAYVANVLAPNYRYAKPKVRFLITDEATGDTIMEESSGPIDPAPDDFLVNGYPPVQSAPWHLVGTTFRVNPGVSLIRLSIYNDENAGIGNDFAMDDIEIRLCSHEVSIDSEHEICQDRRYDFLAHVTDDGGFEQPYRYLWQFAKDSLPFNSEGWMNRHLGLDYTIDQVSFEDEGWYRLCVTSNGVDVTKERYCRAMSEPFFLKVNPCHPCPDLQIITEDTTVCDTLMPFRWRDTLFTEPASVNILLRDSTGCDSVYYTYTLHTQRCCAEPTVIYEDTTVCDTLLPIYWHYATLPEAGTYKVVYRNRRGCDSLIYNCTVHTELCCREMQTVHIDTTVCDTLMPFRWRDTLFTAPATYELLYRNRRGCDSLTAFCSLHTKVCCPDPLIVRHDTTVCDSLMPFTWRGFTFDEPSEKQETEYSSRRCDSIIHVYSLQTELCIPPPVSVYTDTVVCDTLLPYTWHEHLFTEPGTFIRSVIGSRRQTVNCFYTLDTVHCERPCPQIRSLVIDTTVCDTLLPFVWRGLLFEQPSEQGVMELSPRGCDSILHLFALNTVHCDKLWPIIVNKYNWQLACDNVALRSFFPDRMPVFFQWFKNDSPVPGANMDDYAEQNRLHGVFQLQVTLDGNETVWSNIIDLSAPGEELPLNLQIYDSRGRQVARDQLTRGIYLFRYQQGDKVWTDKIMIP